MHPALPLFLPTPALSERLARDEQRVRFLRGALVPLEIADARAWVHREEMAGRSTHALLTAL